MATSAQVGARALLAGGLVVHPTDTLYALAARALDRSAVARLLAAKGRPTGRPLSVAVSSVEEIERWARLERMSRRFVRDELPGPFTVLVRPSAEARRELAAEIASGPTIGLRVPDHPLARELARRAGPLVATSANRSGAPPVRDLAEARRALGAAVAAYVAAPPAPSGVPSTLVDLRGERPRTVRRS
jgi:L-threonylcarbamoyladenylate synthase